MHRLVAPAAGLIALGLAASPVVAQMQQPAQRGGPPGNDTPYILITTFHSDDRKLGVEMADELRRRVSQEHSAKELYVIQKNSINGTLEASGYKADSALSSSDMMELSKQLRGEIVIDGTINKAATGVTLSVKILTKSGQATLAQPLPVTEAKNVGDAAKQVEDAISAANKALPAFKACKNNMLAAKYADAATSAKAGVTAYPNSVFSRVCLLQALVAQKAAPDQIIEVASAIKAADPTSLIALANLADAYLAKGDTNSAIDNYLLMYRADKSNTGIATSIVNMLASTGAPDKAIPIVNELLEPNPADPAMLKTKWLLQLKAERYKDALVSGEALVKADTSAATAEYFTRQMGAAQKDSNSAAMLELAARGAAKFPKEAVFSLTLAQGQMKAGQLDQALVSARKAADANPKDSRGWLLALSIQNQLHQPDSALATAKAAVAAGVPRDSIGQFLLGVAAPALKKAQESKTRADWQEALLAAQAVDAVAPSAQSSFYIGVSAFQVAVDAVTNAQALSKSTKPADKATGCQELQVIEDNFATAQIAMPKGGSVDASTAGTIMQNIQQISDALPQFKKVFGCK